MLLRLLISKQGEAVSREEILEKVWGYDTVTHNRTIDNFILNFRKIFESHPNADKLSVCTVDIGAAEPLLAQGLARARRR